MLKKLLLGWLGALAALLLVSILAYAACSSLKVAVIIPGGIALFCLLFIPQTQNHTRTFMTLFSVLIVDCLFVLRAGWHNDWSSFSIFGFFLIVLIILPSILGEFNWRRGEGLLAFLFFVLNVLSLLLLIRFFYGPF